MTTLGLFYTMKDDTLYVSIYAPYWLLNKTTLPMEYKFSSESNVYEINEFSSESPVLLKCNSKTFFSNKTNISLRVKNMSDWSQQVLIDAVGNTGTITCKSKSKSYEISINIKLSVGGLSKIITLTPYFLLINQLNVK